MWSLYSLVEEGLIPDAIVQVAIRSMLQDRIDEQPPTETLREEHLRSFADQLKTMPIAIKTDEANEQHYEVPTEFFLLTLGTQRKYSCCYYGFGEGDEVQQKDGLKSIDTLDKAEEAMFLKYAERAELVDGQSVLDLGCGWGSLTMWLAKKYPNSSVTSISNSKTQKEFIDSECEKLGLTNVTVITSDVNDVDPVALGLEDTFDRVLSIEMLEHCKNYEKAFKLISRLLKPEGKCFVHVFTHKRYPYHFQYRDEDDWLTKYFFEGGTMPSNDLFLLFNEHLRCDRRWVVDGRNYAKTSYDWLALFDKNRERVLQLFATTYGEKNKVMWATRWRMFYLAVATMFEMHEEWMVCHYLFSPVK
eukprot:TRINITY_DN9062_c0_g1_i1.p1 TRINITY_DN9062_c0_g1~~TRINITY_DN9062_c0_g1_i1.p1  ORF type:complete len:398 (-),score=86.03 TRINITY_DN9062_c0_g1_i1:19-1098(-)